MKGDQRRSRGEEGIEVETEIGRGKFHMSVVATRTKSILAKEM